ncbi:LOW QUALITY PROTEIN: hypothetical protein BT93_A0256 [Corymbia citriodora subsp. variegata]|nr:LOW QUALITY PROTEIN: hypothetical protein BT93_A0256 [Corymbia citriodora subsp. variegata]
MIHAELVFVPMPAKGHLVSMIEMAKLLVDRDPATMLPMDSYTNSLATSVATTRIRFINLPLENVDAKSFSHKIFAHFIEINKPHVKQAIAELADLPGSTRTLAGFVLDMLCTTMIDLADEFGVPSYVFFASSAAFLGLMLHLQSLQDEHRVDIIEFKDSAGELDFLSFTNPLPSKLLPSLFLTNELVRPSLEHARRIRATRGIIINTFDELEPHAVRSLADLGAPAVYLVGPMLNLTGETKKKADDSGEDNGNRLRRCVGSFDEDQRSGHRFLWSLRQPRPKGKILSDYVDPVEVLPEGFLDRMTGLGKVIGWAPQVAVLTQSGIGGFVSRCGWNSILESIWFSVVVATWPLYAEQQFHAFELVVELGLAVEIRMDYRRDSWMESDVVVIVVATPDEIEGRVKNLMEGEEAGERRKKVKEVSEKSRKALAEGSSSYLSLGRLIEDILNNIL